MESVSVCQASAVKATEPVMSPTQSLRAKSRILPTHRDNPFQQYKVQRFFFLSILSHPQPSKHQ